MLRFDKIKLKSDVENISCFNQEAFHAEFVNGELISYKYYQDKPYHLSVLADFQHRKLMLEFSAKILFDKYPSLINKETIRACLLNIDRLGICKLNVEALLTDSEVTKCDVTKDIDCSNTDMKEITSVLQQNMKNYTQWHLKKYKKQGITLENTVKTLRYKKRLIIYDKENELRRGENREFLAILKDKEELLSYFKGKLRFEININTMIQIRTLLGLSGNDLQTVLNASGNPILSVIEEAVRLEDDDSWREVSNLRDFERLTVLRDCNYDLSAVEAKVRAHLSKNTSINRALQPYRELLQQHSDVKYNKTNLRALLSELSE